MMRTQPRPLSGSFFHWTTAKHCAKLCIFHAELNSARTVPYYTDRNSSFKKGYTLLQLAYQVNCKHGLCIRFSCKSSMPQNAVLKEKGSQSSQLCDINSQPHSNSHLQAEPRIRIIRNSLGRSERGHTESPPGSSVAAYGEDSSGMRG